MKTKLLFVFAVLVAVDQIAKNISAVSFCNKNIAWNIPLSSAIFYFVWILIMFCFVYLFIKTKFYIQKFFIILIFSGAVSNMIDRVRFGCVVDYIDLKFWPVFNLADVYITVGIILIILNVIRNKNTKY